MDLSDPAALHAALKGIDVVAHCAGPFSSTSEPMVDACLAAGTHYLDITGEIDVFEAVLARDDEARARGVVLLPGAGFDVVPSDCLAAMLARALPGAVRLELALRASGGVSPGTAKTAMESLGTAARARVDGVIGPVPPDRRRRQVEFADGRSTAHAIAWGDVATAYRSTGIGDIVVFAALPPSIAPVMALAQAAGGATRNRMVQGMLKRVVGRLPGPSAETRAKTQGQLWGQVTDAAGKSLTGTVTTLDPYDLTADAVVRIANGSCRAASLRVPTPRPRRSAPTSSGSSTAPRCTTSGRPRPHRTRRAQAGADLRPVRWRAPRPAAAGWSWRLRV